MISLKECNEQIKALQSYLENNKYMTGTEYIAFYDTLTFYLDMRALLVMRDCSNNNNEGSYNDDLAN